MVPSSCDVMGLQTLPELHTQIDLSFKVQDQIQIDRNHF